MKVNTYEKPLILRAEEGAEFRVGPSTMGEPFRSGLAVELADGDRRVGLFLEDDENWTESGSMFSSAWIDDLIFQLTTCKQALEKGAVKDGAHGWKYDVSGS